MRGRRIKRAWREALPRDGSAGSPQTAAWRWLMWIVGDRPGLWIVDEAAMLQAALASRPLRKAVREGLDTGWLVIGARPSRMTWRYARRQWMPHLWHWTYGRPRYRPLRDATDEERAMHYVGEVEATATIAAREAVKDRALAQYRNRRKVEAYELALDAHDLASRGLSVAEIAAIMGRSRRTVERYLSAPAGLRHADT